MAARELESVSLVDALRLALLIAEFEPERWPRAAARWHARFVLEATGIGLDEAALALSAVRALRGRRVRKFGRVGICRGIVPELGRPDLRIGRPPSRWRRTLSTFFLMVSSGKRERPRTASPSKS